MLILVLLPSSLALEKVIYNGWVKSGEYFDIGGLTFRVIYIRQSNATVVYFPNGLSTVVYPENNSCSSENIYSACVTQQKFEKNGVMVPSNINDLNVDVSVFLKLNQTEIDLDLIREFDGENIFVGDQYQVKTTIEKIGKEDIGNIKFKDVYTDDFFIEVLSGCNVVENSVVWEGSLNRTARHICIYNLRPVRPIKFTNIANLTFDVFGLQNIKTDVFEYDVRDKPIEISYRKDNDSHNAGDTINVNFSIIALSNIKIEEVKIVYPDLFDIVNKSPELIVSGQTLYFEGLILETEDSVNFYADFKTGLVGKHKIKTSITYSYNGLLKTIEEEHFFNYIRKFLQINLRVSNLNDEYFRDIQVYIGSLDEPIYLKRIDSKNFKEFTFPYLGEGDHLIKLQYRTTFGQILYQNYTLKYGESAGYDDFETSSEKEELVEQLDNVVEQVNEEIKTKKGFDINIDTDILLIVIGSIFGIIILFVIFGFIKKKFGKSSLDKQIQDLQKQEDKLVEEEESFKDSL